MKQLTPSRMTPRRSVRADVALILLLATPAVIIPGGLDRFVFGKLLVAAVGAGLAFTVPATGLLSRAVRVLLGAGATILLLAALLSVSPVISLLGRAPRYEGFPTLAIYLLAGLAGARLLGPGRTGRTIQIALTAMAWCVIAVGLLAVAESLGLRPLSSDVARPGSLLGNASDQGAFGVLYGGPLLLAALKHRAPVTIAGTIGAGAAVVLSGSRGALLGLLVMVVLAGVLLGRRRWKPIALTLAIVAAAAVAIPFTRDRLLGSSPLAGRTVTGRELLWQESLALVGGHPWWGVGPSQFEMAIVPYHDLTWQQVIGPINPPGSPHNLLLQAGAAGGVLLALVLLALGVLLVRATVRHWRQAAENTWLTGTAAGLAGYTAALQFHLTSPGTTIPACLLAGGVLAMAPRTARERGPRAGQRLIRSAIPLVAAFLAAMFLLAALGEVYLQSASRAVAAGDIAAADAAYQRALDLRPWDVDLPGQALARFAAVGTSGGPDAPAALDAAQRWTARLGPIAGDEQVVQNRAAVLLQSGRDRAAARLLDRQLALDPDNPALLVLRGVVDAQVGRYHAAIDEFRHATRVDPTDPRAWHDLAFAYTQLGRTDEAARAQATARHLADGT